MTVICHKKPFYWMAISIQVDGIIDLVTAFRILYAPSNSDNRHINEFGFNASKIQLNETCNKMPYTTAARSLWRSDGKPVPSVDLGDQSPSVLRHGTRRCITHVCSGLVVFITWHLVKLSRIGTHRMIAFFFFYWLYCNQMNANFF